MLQLANVFLFYFWFCRCIHLSEIRDGRLSSSRVVVRFVESEANVPCMLEKIKLAMGNSDAFVLTDAQGNEVLESEGTTGKYGFGFSLPFCKCDVTDFNQCCQYRFMLLEAEFKEISCCGKGWIQAVAAEEGSNEVISWSVVYRMQQMVTFRDVTRCHTITQ